MLRFLILFLFAFAAPAWAGNFGVDFTNMPVGLQAWYQGSENRRWVDVYVGQRGGRHVMERRLNSAYGELAETRFYDPQGHEVERHAAAGHWQTFTPRNCIRVLGPCRAEVTDSRSGPHIIHGTMHVDGDTYYYKWVADHHDDTMRAHYRLGAYNLPSWSRSNDYLMVLKDIVEPSGQPAAFAH